MTTQSRRAAERGSVSLEFAFGLPAALFVFVLLAQGLVVLNGHVHTQATAREAARIAAIAYDEQSGASAARAFVERAEPAAELRLTGDGPYIIASVERRMRTPLWPAGFTISSAATAMRELP